MSERGRERVKLYSNSALPSGIQSSSHTGISLSLFLSSLLVPSLRASFLPSLSPLLSPLVRCTLCQSLVQIRTSQQEQPARKEGSAAAGAGGSRVSARITSRDPFALPSFRRPYHATRGETPSSPYTLAALERSAKHLSLPDDHEAVCASLFLMSAAHATSFSIDTTPSLSFASSECDSLGSEISRERSR